MHLRKARTWLIRPTPIARGVGLLFMVCFSPIALIVVGTAWGSSAAWERTGYLTLFVLLTALMVNAALNQGAYIGKDHVTLETVLGMARIPKDQIDAVHLDGTASMVVVETRGRYVYQTITTKYGRDVSENPTNLDELEDHGFVTIHDDATELFRLRPARFASFHGSAIVATLARPNIWIPVAMAALVGLLA